jgi:predicted DNA-binding protein
MTMVRTQISLEPNERDLLNSVSKVTNKSISALIREAIHIVYGERVSSAQAQDAILESFGRINVDSSGEELVNRLRTGSRLAPL